MDDLEKILMKLPKVRTGVDKGWEEFRQKMRVSIQNYRIDGLSLEEKAHANGRQDFQQYVDQVVDEKYKTLYTAHKVVEGLKDALESVFPKGKGLDDIALRFSGKKLLLPAYLALYAAEKVVNESVGQYYGIYDGGLKGSLNYAADMLGLQANYVAEIAGVGGLVKKIGFADLEKRIIDSAVRDMVNWTETGEIRSRGQIAVDKVCTLLDKAATSVKGALVDYNRRPYSADRVAGAYAPA